MATAAPRNSPWPPPPSPELAVPAGIRGEQFHAMGTTISLLLPTHAAAVGTVVARCLFACWEQTLSRFQPESELSELNQAPAGTPVTVGPLLYTVLAAALAAAQHTGGIFDPSMQAQIAHLGYDRSFEHLGPDVPAPMAPATPGGGWRAIRLDPEYRQVTLPAAVTIDLGGIAKGLAADATLARLRQLGIGPALVSAGGDLAVLGTPPGATAWPIAVPVLEGFRTITLGRGAMATSGRARRHWRQGEHDRHHLLDPRTGEPVVTTLQSVTTVATSCGQAEVAAKVAFVLGPDAGTEYLEAHGLAGLFVDESGAYRVAGPWPAAAMNDTTSGGVR